MRLLIMAVQFKGGSLQGVVSIIRELVKFSDNEYHIVLSKEVKDQLHDVVYPVNMHVYDLPNKIGNHTINLFLNRWFFDRLECRLNPDVVLCSSGPMYWKPKKPCLMGYNLGHHIYRDSPYYDIIDLAAKTRWFFRRTFHRWYFRREGDAFFVQTDDVNKRLRKYIGVSDIYTVSNTFSVAYLNIEDYPKKLPPREGNETRCLTISAFYPHKNLGVIKKVVDRLEELGRSDIQFVVTLPQDRYDQLFPSQYKDRIINVGFVPSKEGPSLYNECDIMFLPTLLECFSASYAEAMIMRKPIITSDMGFAHTVCKDAAIYFNPVDVNDIVDKLIRLVDDKELQKDLINKGEMQKGQFGTSEDRVKGILDLCEMLKKKGKRR